MLAAALGLAASGAVNGQTLGFYAREQEAAISRDDKSVAVAFWAEDLNSTPPLRWVYAAAYVTERDASNNPHTRLAVYKYDANADMEGERPEPEAKFYFPPLTVSAAGQHAATAMVVDDSTGDLYVCGSTTIGEDGQETGTNLNYVVVKLNQEDLTPAWSGLVTNSAYHYARIYDGPAGGEDRAVSLALSGGVGDLFVTGTSAGDGTGTDIVTLRLRRASGAYAGAAGEWPAAYGEDDGIRRWDNPSVHGDDAAAEVGWGQIGGSGEGGFTAAYVVGTSDYGDDSDLQALAYGANGVLNPTPNSLPDDGWEAHIDGGGDDAGTGLTTVAGNGLGLWVCGSGEGPQDVDFLGARLDVNTGGVMRLYPCDFGADDFCRDMAVTIGTGTVPPAYVWLVGVSAGTSEKAATVAFLDGTSPVVCGVDAFQYFTGGNAALSAVVPPHDLVGGVWAAGRAMSGVSDTDTLAIRYTIDPNWGTLGDPPPLVRAWVLRSPPWSETGTDEALCLTVAGDEVFLGGYSTDAATGPNLLTVRIDQTP